MPFYLLYDGIGKILHPTATFFQKNMKKGASAFRKYPFLVSYSSAGLASVSVTGSATWGALTGSSTWGAGSRGIILLR